MATVEAWRQRGLKKYHKTGVLLFFARTTKLQKAVPNLRRRALSESLRVGGSFYSGIFGIGCVGVPLWWA